MNRKQKTVIIGLFGNLFLTAAKTFLSFLSGSAALMADALHSFSDLLVSIIVFTGLKFNKKRIEAYVSLFVGVLIIFIAVGFVIELLTKEPSQISKIGITVFGQLLIIICTYVLYKYKYMVGLEERSESLIADGRHTKSDMLSSLGVLLSISGSLIGLNLDRIAAFIIFFLILYQGLETIINAFQSLGESQKRINYFHNDLLGDKIAVMSLSFFKKIRMARKRTITIFSIILFSLYFVLGFFTVDQSEAGIRSLFGIVDQQIIKPGIHFDPLFFLSKIEKINTGKIRTMEYGFRYNDLNADDVIINQWETIHNSRRYTAIDDEELILTGDGSIVDIGLILEYRISEVLEYLLSTESPEDILRMETGSELQTIAGSIPLFKILNSDRSFIETELKESLNLSLNTIGTGLIVVDINLISLTPHEKTLYMFRTVEDEEQNRDTLIYNAQAVKEKQIPYFRGLAYEKIQNAQANAQEIVLNAQSEIILYKVMEKEFLHDKEGLSYRLLLNSRSEILKNSEKILIESSMRSNFIRLDKRSGE